MREIKFRGKDIVTSEWRYGDLRHRIACCPSIIHDYNNNGKIDYAETPVHRDSVDQFTGLFDKNGKEIYEGDILRGDDYPFYDAEKDSYNYYAIVEWDEEAAQFYAYIHLAKDAEVRGISQGIGEDMENLREMEVIGNIHDNPELLNK